ncbi:MAG: hypothetical protein O3A53_07925 [Acidobacteria bacterium]|nr:hypothetical protein [Acidobacteriota bacterium]MDA1234714.1 hypothetical protein [Acidobacteriota bacterium]
MDDFAVRQEESELVAEWTWPVLGSEGQVFREMERFEIYSLFVPPGSDLPAADAMSDHGELVTTVVAQAPGPTGPGTNMVVRAPLFGQYGSKRGFAVRGVSVKGRSASWSELRTLDVVQPPGAPADLSVTVLEQGVRVVWAAVEDAVRYEVQRRVAEGEFVAMGSTDGPEFLDTSPQWDMPHSYLVRALKPAGDSLDVPGPPAKSAALTPRDVFPPAAPVDLRAIAVEGGVELSWSSNSEADLGGYRVLRDGLPVHQGLLDSANFSDQPLSAGQTVVYQVMAIDRSGNSSRPAEVQTVSLR